MVIFNPHFQFLAINYYPFICIYWEPYLLILFICAIENFLSIFLPAVISFLLPHLPSNWIWQIVTFFLLQVASIHWNYRSKWWWHSVHLQCTAVKVLRCQLVHLFCNFKNMWKYCQQELNYHPKGFCSQTDM